VTRSAPTAPRSTPSAFSRYWNKGLEYLQYGPKFLRQRPVFAACRMAYYARYTPEPPSPEIAGIMEQLERDGAVVIRGLFQRPVVDAMLDEVKDGLRRLTDDGELPGMDVYVSRDYGVARILKVDDHFPATRAFFEHETVWQVARAYVSTRVESYLRMAELRDRVGAISSSDIAHFDDWRKRFKAFVLLNDVDEGHAPFVYYRGSHKGGVP